MLRLIGILILTSNSDLEDDDDFANRWFAPVKSETGETKLNIVQQNMEAIRAYAYEAFDKIDTNGNGFIETEELYAAVDDDNIPMREKSYIMFLLTHQQEIADSQDEGVEDMRDGISRLDIEHYFKLVQARLA